MMHWLQLVEHLPKMHANRRIVSMHMCSCSSLLQLSEDAPKLLKAVLAELLGRSAPTTRVRAYTGGRRARGWRTAEWSGGRGGWPRGHEGAGADRWTGGPAGIFSASNY